jgi:hypothetical protein
MTNVVIFSDGGSKSKIYSPQRSSGPYRIATEIRNKGFSCQVISFFSIFNILEIEKICEKFVNDDTLVVGFSTTFWNWGYGPELFRNIKTVIDFVRKFYSDKIKIVFGGPNGLEVLKQNQPEFDIDYIFLGYVDKIFSDFVYNLSSGKDVPTPTSRYNTIGIYNSKNEDFDFSNSQIVFREEDYIFPGESVVLEVGRGCIFRCKFCDYPLNGKKKLDYIKYQDILYDELSRNFYDHGIDKYILSDDTFNDSPEKIEQLHKLFTSLPFKINFSAYLRLDLLNAHKNHIELLHDMGLRGTQFGIESFHEKASRVVGKGMDENKSKKLLYDLKNEHWKSDIKIQTSFIVGLPYEDQESFKKLEDWIRDEEYCLVDKIQVEPLHLSNPRYDNNPWSSDFQVNSVKYGYYWPDNDVRLLWKNLIHPIKSLVEANKIVANLRKALTDTDRNTLGGFGVFANYVFTQYDTVKIPWDAQLKMDRHQYSKFYKTVVPLGMWRHLQWYKSKLLESGSI